MVINYSYTIISRKVAQPPGVLFAKQRFLHGPSALQDLSFEVLVGILFVGGGRGAPPERFDSPLVRVLFAKFNAISY